MAIDLNQLRVSGIYQIVNLVNGKIYTGSAVNVRSRWTEHRWHLNRGSHHSTHLQNSWNFYGYNSFKIQLLEQCDKTNLIKREQFWLDKFRSFEREIGYNICRVAGSTFGKKDSLKTKAKKSRSATGRKHTKSTKLKIFIAKAGKAGTFTGKVHSEKSKDKMSKSSQNGRKTVCKRGHKFTKANTRYFANQNGNLGRSCRKCHALREANRRNAHRKTF